MRETGSESVYPGVCVDKSVLAETIAAAQLHKNEKKLNSINLALVLVHDALLASGGIQAGDGPLKQAVLRHKTRLNSELQRIKIKRGVSSNAELAASADAFHAVGRAEE